MNDLTPFLGILVQELFPCIGVHLVVKEMQG